VAGEKKGETMSLRAGEGGTQKQIRREIKKKKIKVEGIRQDF